MDPVSILTEHVDGGSCASIEELCNQCDIDFDSLTQEQLEEIDQYLFTCCQCDWTLPIDRLSQYDEDELICDECH